MSDPIYTDRDTARERLTEKVERYSKGDRLEDKFFVKDALWRLRWIDCAPEGANHQMAPLQDKAGVPCGSAVDENVGPNLALREARVRVGRHPISGLALTPLPELPPVAHSLPFEVLLEGFDEQAHGLGEIDGSGV